MELLSPTEMLSDLSCSACREPTLSCRDHDGVKTVVCNKCGRPFSCHGSIIDFLLQDCLDQTNRNELKGNEFDVEDPEVAAHMSNKDKWNLVYTHSLMHAINTVCNLIANYSSCITLYCLGSGTGFEIKALCFRRQFKRIYSSDISGSALAVARQILEPFEGELGLFVSEFSHTPVKKKPGNLGLVFQALHHTTDIHQSIECLLKHNFTDLVIVEPTTNWLVEILAYFGLAKRREYSGLQPSWMDLGLVQKIAAQYKYSTQIHTWWEVPPGLARFFNRNRLMVRIACHAIDLISTVTGYFKFGSMSAIRFTSETQQRDQSQGVKDQVRL